MPVQKPFQLATRCSKEGRNYLKSCNKRIRKRRREGTKRQVRTVVFILGRNAVYDPKSYSATARQKRKMLGNRRQKLRLGYKPH